MLIKLLNPFSRIHPSWIFMGFVTGIILGDILMLVLRIEFFAAPIWLACAIITALVALLMSRRCCLILALIAGVITMSHRGAIDLAGQTYLQRFVGQVIMVTGTIAEDPDTSESKTTVRLTDLKMGGKIDKKSVDSVGLQGAQATPGALYASLAKNTTLRRSDTVTLRGKMGEGFGTFSGTLYRPTIIANARGSPGDIFLNIRDWFSSNITEHVPSPENALGLGYLLGMRSSLPTGMAEMLKVVGLTHIIVASGANLSILIRFSRKILGKLSRFAGLFGSVLLVVFYVGMVGITPSMSRAGLVSALSLIVWYVGREFRPVRLLMIVAGITLLYNPMYVIDLGWLLSFASFAGIMLLSPFITKFFYGEKKPGIIGGTIIETMSASLICLPILLYFFGTISLISLVASLLILPTTTAAMVLTFVTGVLNLFFTPLAALVGQICTWLLSYHLWVINFFGTQKMFMVNIGAENPFIFLIYLPIIGILIWPKIRTKIVRNRENKTKVLNFSSE